MTYSSEPGGKCYNKTLKVLNVTSDGSSYVICPSRGSQPQLNACPNVNERFNSTSWKCSFACPREGFFPHAQDKNKYYQCTSTKKGMEQNVVNCAANTEFDPLLNFCVKKEEESTTTANLETTTQSLETTTLL